MIRRLHHTTGERWLRQLDGASRLIAAIGLGLVGLVIACASPPPTTPTVQAVATAVAPTVDAARSLEAPTVQAAQTQFAPTVSGASAAVAPTVVSIRATATAVAPTVVSIQTTATAVAPTVQAVVTQIAPTVEAAATITTSALATQAEDPQVAAIQEVVERALQQQVQAVVNGDPSLMRDSATAAYYRQLVQVGQSLAADGVTGLAVSQLTWGPVKVDGSTATAKTTETWFTQFDDGTTALITTAAVYTLEQQNGLWLIDANRRSAATPAPATPVATPVPAPALAVGRYASNNWSGYAAVAGPYTTVSGTWQVLAPVTTGDGGAGATWVGIGGMSSSDLIQAGTSATVVKGQVRFESWIETLPDVSQQVPLAVASGDSVTVRIDEQDPDAGVWQMSIMNNTTGQSYQTTVTYASSHSSAEWIQEAPTGSQGLLPLNNFGSVTVSGAKTTMNGQAADLAQANAHPLTMVNADNQPLAVPSTINDDGASFSVVRTSAPATVSTGGPGQRANGTPTATPAN